MLQPIVLNMDWFKSGKGQLVIFLTNTYKCSLKWLNASETWVYIRRLPNFLHTGHFVGDISPGRDCLKCEQQINMLAYPTSQVEKASSENLKWFSKSCMESMMERGILLTFPGFQAIFIRLWIQRNSLQILRTIPLVPYKVNPKVSLL